MSIEQKEHDHACNYIWEQQPDYERPDNPGVCYGCMIGIYAAKSSMHYIKDLQSDIATAIDSIKEFMEEYHADV